MDEYARFEQEALDISGFSAVHIPEECGGQGADSVATRVVIDEVVARGPDLPGADSERIYVVPRARRRLLATFDERLSGYVAAGKLGVKTGEGFYKYGS